MHPLHAALTPIAAAGCSQAAGLIHWPSRITANNLGRLRTAPFPPARFPNILVSSTTNLTEALADRYRIERELGRGGMATVYLAQDMKHDRRVAVKVLHPDLAAALGGERFLAEIKTTAALQHPHILPLHDSGEAGGVLFYVMPFVDGESLRDRLNRERQLPIDDALRIAREVADALQSAHEHGVIHRDIKPENILLQGGHALVADFGIALAVQQAGGSRMTQTGLSLGTPQYMSPEQAMGEKSIDKRSDLYALGAVTYEMLAGEAPFSGPTVQAIVAKVLTDTARPLSELRKSVPDYVSDAVAHALEKLPADRVGSAAAFLAALAGEGDVTRKPATRKREARARTHALGNPIVTVVAVCVAVASAAWSLWARYAPQPVTHATVARFSISIPSLTSGIVPGNVIAVSPDGSKIVYLARDPVRPRIYLALRRLEAEAIAELPGTEDPSSPFFSPDGESIAFAQGNRLMRLDLAGGAPRTLVDLGAGAAPYGGAWSPGGTIIFSTQSGRMFTVPASGGPATQLAGVDSALYRYFVWLPDGKRVLATRELRTGARLDMAVISSETAKLLATIVPGLSLQLVRTGELAYVSPDGTLMSARFDLRSLKLIGAPLPVVSTGATPFAFFARSLPVAVSASGTVAYVSSNFGDFADKEMVLVAPGTPPQVLPLGRRNFRGPRFSPDGKRIAVDVEPGGDLVGDIWLYDRAASTFARLTFEGTGVFPEWTRDGSALLYSAVGASGSRELYRVPADRSSPPAMLVHGDWPIFESSPSPNNGPLFFRDNAEGSGRDIYIVRNGQKPAKFAASQFQERSPAVSPDGGLVLYTSNESGTDQIYVRRVDGEERAQVSTGGGSEPRWTPAGREALYWNGDTLFSVPISTTLSVGARRPVLVGVFAREPFHSNYDLAPDGKTFVMLRSAVAGAPTTALTVLLNWFDSERRTPSK